MKRIGVIAPAGRRGTLQAAKEVFLFMRERGVDVYCEGFLREALPETGLLRKGVQVDAICALGGDGTILRSVPYAAGLAVPVMGVNLGTKGFLAACEPDDLKDTLQALYDGKVHIDPRPLLCLNGDEHLLALNDAAILRGGRQRLMHVRVKVDGENVGVYSADGILLATPTGSTGYALSAGGPICMPGTECLEIIPICAHSLQSRPIVIASESRVTFEMTEDPEMEGMLQLDGRTVSLLHASDVAELRLSEKTLQLVRAEKNGFFNVVNRKLTEWSM